MRHSKSGLILIEMILVILFLAIAGSFCARIFVGAHKESLHAEALTRAQQQAEMAAELMKETEPEWSAYFPQSIGTKDSVTVSYDENWDFCNEKQAVYQMKIMIGTDGADRSGEIQVLDLSKRTGQTEIYRLNTVTHIPAVYQQSGSGKGRS